MFAFPVVQTAFYYFFYGYFSNSSKKGSENRGALNLNGKDMEAFFISRI